MRQRKIYILFFVLTIISLFPQTMLATYYSTETTRLKSTAGAGVGSILMDEATILNPAPLAFFNVLSFYYQSTFASLNNRDESSFTSNPPDPEQTTFILSDASSGLKGSLSYQKNIFDFNERERYGLSLATTIGPQSAAGVAYRITKEKNRDSDNGSLSENSYKQFTFGITHAISEAFSLGLVVIDPFKEKKEDRFAILGAQYLYAGFISLILDGGADYSKDLSTTAYYAAAIQFKIFSDFFLRFGTFKNRANLSNGNGIVVGWVQPKLVLEFSIKNNAFAENLKTGSEKMDIKETAFSVSLRF